MTTLRRFILALSIISSLATINVCNAVGQTPAPSPTPAGPSTAAIAPGTADEKSQVIIKHAIEVLGGQAYLSVQSVIGKGFYTAFNDGVSQLPSKFLDYIVYPDRERMSLQVSGLRRFKLTIAIQVGCSMAQLRLLKTRVRPRSTTSSVLCAPAWKIYCEAGGKRRAVRLCMWVDAKQAWKKE